MFSISNIKFEIAQSFEERCNESQVYMQITLFILGCSGTRSGPVCVGERGFGQTLGVVGTHSRTRLQLLWSHDDHDLLVPIRSRGRRPSLSMNPILCTAFFEPSPTI